jgi:homospermidine synthase
MVNRGKRFVSENLTWEAYSKVVAVILEKVRGHFFRRASQ